MKAPSADDDGQGVGQADDRRQRGPERAQQGGKEGDDQAGSHRQDHPDGDQRGEPELVPTEGTWPQRLFSGSNWSR